MSKNNLPDLDPILHQPVRTRLVSLLTHKPHSFSQLKQSLNITDGNLDAHLKKLSSAGYLHSQMLVDGKRPQTIYELSDTGKSAYQTYTKNIRVLLNFPIIPDKRK